MNLTESKLKELILEMMEDEEEYLPQEELDNLISISESDPEHGEFMLESLLEMISEEQLEQIKSKLIPAFYRKGMLEAVLRFMFLDKEYPYYEQHEPEKMDSPLNSMRLKNSDVARELLEKYKVHYDVNRDVGKIEIGEIVGYRDDVFWAIKRFFDLELDKNQYSFYLHKLETKSSGMVIEEGHISKKSYQGDEKELHVEIDFAYITYPGSDERKMEKLQLTATTRHEEHRRRTRAVFRAGYGGPNNKRKKGDVAYYIRFGDFSGRDDLSGTTYSVQVPILIENAFFEYGWKL